MSSEVKVLFINGSPRRYGQSSQLMNIAIRGARDAGAHIDVVYLYDHVIKPCLGCVSDNTKYCRFPCIIDDDDFNIVAKKVVESDGLVIVTPVYWYSPSGLLKNFIDRLTSLENMIFHGSRSLLEGKVVGFIATGLDSGVFMTISYLMAVLNSMGAIVAPWSMAYTHIEDVTMDEGALRDAYNVGYLVVETVKAIKRYGSHIGYKPNVDIASLKKIVEEHRASTELSKTERIRLIEELLSRNSSR